MTEPSKPSSTTPLRRLAARLNRPLPFAVVAAFLCVFTACDQSTKRHARDTLSVDIEASTHRRATAPRVLIPQTLRLAYAENDDAAFNVLRAVPPPARRGLLSVLAGALALFFVARLYRRRSTVGATEALATALIVGGAVGNLIDRVRDGYVTDFIVVQAGLVAPDWPPWPTFNVADGGIVVGALCLVALSFRRDPVSPDAPAWNP